MKDEQQKQQNNNGQNFFRFTKHQLSVNLEKYDSVVKGNPVTLGANAMNASAGFNSAAMPTRLNSMDSSMLEDAAYNVLDDIELKLEKKIEKIEAAIRALNEKIIVADTIQDDATKKELLKQKKILLQNREVLLVQYKSQNSETFMVSVLTELFKLPKKIRKNIRKSFKKFLRTSKLMQHFTPLVRSLTVRDTLGRLNKINKSVDELVNMKVPFGEQEERYETLVTHLSRAGALHSQIMRELNS